MDIARHAIELARGYLAIWLLLGVAGCEREAPSCEAVARHAGEHIYARPFVHETDVVHFVFRHPFSIRLTEKDVWYVEDQCNEEGWSPEYRLCVVSQRGSGFRCGREDIVWSTLPRVREWLDELANGAANIHWHAQHRVTVAEREVERLTGELKWNGDGTERQLERARDDLREARRLATACEIKPLDQPTCVALLP